MKDADDGGSLEMEIISPVFRSGSPIPIQYTCQGQNVNPPLVIFNPPAGAQSLALIMHDPDAPGGDYLHWLVWDIPPHTESIPVNSVPIGALQGLNGGGKPGYMGPCPPAGTGAHRYVFDLYALDAMLHLQTNSVLKDVMAAMLEHTMEHSSLIGVYSS
jgi:Raf kinase inhibitor-like YbhB/YbcL family protein